MKITPTKAAELLNCSPQLIRIGLQRNILPFGEAVKMSSKWTYLISPGRLADYMGISTEELERMIS